MIRCKVMVGLRHLFIADSWIFGQNRTVKERIIANVFGMLSRGAWQRFPFMKYKCDVRLMHHLDFEKEILLQLHKYLKCYSVQSVAATNLFRLCAGSWDSFT